MLCDQKRAGFEIEFRLFAAKYSNLDIEESKTVKPYGKVIRVNNVIKNGSPIRLNFVDTDYYGLGWDESTDYYSLQQWENIGAETNWSVNPKPNYLNYEFKTFGGLLRLEFGQAQDSIITWTDGIFEVCYATDNRTDDLKNDQINYFNVGDQILVTPRIYDNYDRFRPIYYKPQVTFSTNIVYFLNIVKILLNDTTLNNKNFLCESVINFISPNSFTEPIDQNIKEEMFSYSGVKYFKKLRNRLFSLTNFPNSSIFFEYERNYLLFVSSFWFLDVHTFKNKLIDKNSGKSVLERSVELMGNNYLKGYSAFLPRSNESKNIENSTIYWFLEAITPFYAIYLPYKVCSKPEETNIILLKDRLQQLEIILNSWSNKVATAEENEREDLKESIERGREYLKTTLADIEQNKCFDYSFSLYLIDISRMPKDENQLVINWFYNNNINIADKRLIQSSYIPNFDKTTIILENRSLRTFELDADHQNMIRLFDNFINSFYN